MLLKYVLMNKWIKKTLVQRCGEKWCLPSIYHVADLVLGDWVALPHLILTTWEVASSPFRRWGDWGAGKVSSRSHSSFLCICLFVLGHIALLTEEVLTNQEALLSWNLQAIHYHTNRKHVRAQASCWVKRKHVAPIRGGKSSPNDVQSSSCFIVKCICVWW